MLPESVMALERKDGGRNPLLTEVTALTWVLEWPGDVVDAHGVNEPSGVGAFRDVYDYASGRDIREIVHLAGSRRSVVDLIAWLREDAGTRPCIGSVHVENISMRAALEAMHFVTSRIVIEAPPWVS